jgi:hypothetical protein
MRQAARAPSRPLLAAERCADEPTTGGLNYDESIEEWGIFSSEDKERWENGGSPLLDLYSRDYYDDYVWCHKRYNFEEERWPAGEFVCFATPIHGKWGHDRRIIFPEQAQHRLLFEGDRAREGTEFDDWDWESFIRVRFYKQVLAGERSTESPPAATADAEPVAAEPLLRRGEVARAAVSLLETRKTELVKTNGLLAAAAEIAGLVKVEKPIAVATIRKYIASRFWELAAEMGVTPSPTSPKSKPPR